MLVELNISNFAIIDRLSLRLNPGFNSLTGETGAGKSIIIDAMGAMLGEKIGVEFVRHGTTQARVEGFFEVLLDLEDERFARLLHTLEENALLEDDNQPQSLVDAPHLKKINLTLTRELNSTGRSTCRVNGSPVKQDLLRQVGDALVDIHGQTAHISLLRVNEHLELLDQYANLAPQRSRLAEMVGTLRNIRKEIASLQQDERELARRLDLLKFQVEEIETANLQPGEEELLQKERVLLNSAEKITTLADQAYRILYQGYDETGGGEGYAPVVTPKGRGGRNAAAVGASVRAVRDSLSDVQGVLSDLERYEPDMAKQREALEEALYRLEEVAYAVRDFRDRIEADPGRLEEVEERLELIRTLKRKYGTGISEIIEFGKSAAAELDKIEHSGERLLELQAQESKLLNKLGGLAGEISAKRQEAGLKLAGAVEKALADLQLMRARFQVHVTQSQVDDGIPIRKPGEGAGANGNGASETKRYAFGVTGIDRVEFYVSLNPGEPPKPLQKVASGGETSRLMLALKSILAAADAIPTLIFDEVDVGVGGRSGQAVGEKLWQLSNQAHHQVICISHLPQTAAFGDAHFYIRKQINGERTTTTVSQLNEQERIDELGVMMGGVPLTDIKRRGAAELLAEIESWKQVAQAQNRGEYVLLK